MSTFYHQIARFYDAVNADQVDDTPLYLEEANQARGPILDVGCGSGRLLFPLLAAGHHVHGIDREAAMLAIAKRHASELPTSFRARLQLFHSNVLEQQFSESYSLILLSFNLLMHFHEQDTQLLLLKRLRQAARESARLIIDLPHPEAILSTANEEDVQFERDFIHPETGHRIQVFSRSQLDWSQQLLTVMWIYDEIAAEGNLKRTVATQLLRYFTMPEMRWLLKDSGWSEYAVYGDYDLCPFQDGYERMLIFANNSKQ